MAPLIPSSNHNFAPYHDVPDHNHVVIEHPGVVQNIDKGLASLGGDRRLESFLSSQAPMRSLNLFLRPDEPFRKSIESRAVTTENVILQVTVPKRTGRKRKRGSHEPFNWAKEGPKDDAQLAEYQVRSLKDNPRNSTVKAVGMTEEIHRFRGLPDFQWSLATSRLANNLKASVLQPDYESLSNFKFDESKGIERFNDMIPPPILAQNSIPFNYAYRQNAMVKTMVDATGRQITFNRQAPARIFTPTVTHDCPASEIPTAIPAAAAPEDSLDDIIKSLIKQTREFMQNERPIATRRVLLNHVGQNYGNELKHVFQYCGYYFRSGPWRDALIPFGVDPRTDPKYRVYQTMTFKIIVRGKVNEPEDRTKWNRSVRLNPTDAPDNMTHIFDGTRVTPDAKVWQACDVTDPLLRSILDGDPPREVCEILQDGWYLNGAWAKARVIMRDKIGLIMSGVTPTDSIYDKLVAIPNHLTVDNLQVATFFAKKDGFRVMEMAGDIRQMARVLGGDPTERGKMRNGKPIVRRIVKKLRSTVGDDDANVGDEEAGDAANVGDGEAGDAGGADGDDQEMVEAVAEEGPDDEPLEMDG